MCVCMPACIHRCSDFGENISRGEYGLGGGGVSILDRQAVREVPSKKVAIE